MLLSSSTLLAPGPVSSPPEPRDGRLARAAWATTGSVWGLQPASSRATSSQDQPRPASWLMEVGLDLGITKHRVHVCYGDTDLATSLMNMPRQVSSSGMCSGVTVTP